MDLLRENRRLYLDLLQKSILNLIYEDAPVSPWLPENPSFDLGKRIKGLDWPSVAHSMIGALRMSNLRQLCESAINNHIPGDFIETGVWRGGSCIMMRGVIKSYGERDRRVWVADSFAGLPPPNEQCYPEDKGDVFHTYDELAISLDEVKSNFRKYGLLDEQVVFLKGWFKDTLPSAAIERIAVLRLDGDMYESTIQALDALYHKVSPGGFVIVDDYGCVDACRKAVSEFRATHAIIAPIVDIDGTGVYWEKPKS
jgi:O-methyltransferase